MAKPYVIAIEEHYADPRITAAGPPAVPSAGLPGIQPRLVDLGEVRLQEMDAAGIDFQVISHAPSPLQQLNAETAVELAIATNNRLKEAIDAHPDRFGGFASLPTPDPAAAADELERCVSELGFKGAIIHGRTGDLYHDDKRFWPIFERAQRLDVPIYLHPGPPHPAMAQAFYGDLVSRFPWLNSAAWGFTIDTANQAIRLILSGVFEEYPELKVILGHQGEGLPFLVDRIDEALNRGPEKVAFKQTFCRNFYVTTSGHFSTPALLCTLLEMGIDRVLFSVDWPFVENQPGIDWMAALPLSDEDKEKLYNGNARRLLKLSA